MSRLTVNSIGSSAFGTDRVETTASHLICPRSPSPITHHPSPITHELGPEHTRLTIPRYQYRHPIPSIIQFHFSETFNTYTLNKPGRHLPIPSYEPRADRFSITVSVSLASRYILTREVLTGFNNFYSFINNLLLFYFILLLITR